MPQCNMIVPQNPAYIIVHRPCAWYQHQALAKRGPIQASEPIVGYSERMCGPSGGAAGTATTFMLVAHCSETRG
jgi:hypothetical protein